MLKRKMFIATHSNLAEGFKNAAKLILGDLAEEITTFCLIEGQSADDYSDEVKEYSRENPDTEIVVLTDLHGASLFNAMSILSNEDNIFVFTGTNLAMVLDILFEPRELTKSIIEEKIQIYRDGMVWLEKLEVGIEEDF